MNSPSLPLTLQQSGSLWQLVDALGKVRVESTSRALLEDACPEIATSLQTAAHLASNSAELGIGLRGWCRWIA